MSVYVSNNDSKTIVKGRGWDQNDWKNKIFPNKSKLDELFPDIPVVLERIDGHAYLVNQKALDMAKINSQTKEIAGTIIKVKGKLTGILIDGPMGLIDDVLPELTNSEKEKALLDAQKICFANLVISKIVKSKKILELLEIEFLHLLKT